MTNFQKLFRWLDESLPVIATIGVESLLLYNIAMFSKVMFENPAMNNALEFVLLFVLYLLVLIFCIGPVLMFRSFDEDEEN